MLGLNSNFSGFKTVNDFKSSADYLNYLFNDCRGLLYRVTLNPFYYQKALRPTGLNNIKFDKQENCYISMNTFFRTSNLSLQEGRDSSHLKRLSSLYVDIDCYKLGLSKQDVILELQDNFFGSIIPHPTFVVDSGRGIYLIWKLRNEDRNALPRWSAVQRYLTDSLQELGSDSACVDASRILRVPFSVNTKSNSVVTILEFNDFTYSLYDIMREYDINIKKRKRRLVFPEKKKYPFNHATEKQRKYVKDLARRLNLSKEHYPDFTSFNETDVWIKAHKNISLNHNNKDSDYMYKNGSKYFLEKYKIVKNLLSGYCEDIKKLLTMRKGENCKREIGLFLYRYFLRELKYNSDEALEKTLELNDSLDVPFDEKYVVKATANVDRRIESGIPYLYKKTTIAKVLEITKDEMSSLPSFSSLLESYMEKKRERNRKSYEKKLLALGKQTKKDEVLKRRASILAMKEQGKTPLEIQKELNISRATYHRDVTSLTVTSIFKSEKALTTKQAEKTTNIAKKTIKTVKKAGFIASFRDALKCIKDLLKIMSHFFSTPFIIKYTYGVPHACVFPSVVVLWIVIIKNCNNPEENY